MSLFLKSFKDYKDPWGPLTLFIVYIMGCKKLSIEEKTRVLTMLEDGDPVICVAANLHVSRQAIYDQNGRQQGFHLALNRLEKW